MKFSAWLVPLALLASGAVAPLAGCSSEKNHAERENAPEAIAAHPAPDPDPVQALEDAKAAPIGAGLPDPGSRNFDAKACAKIKDAAHFEYAWSWDFATDLNHARSTYSYDDNTPSLVVPPHNGWEPGADPVPEVCGVNLAVRFKGGRFTEYGGGFGQSFCTTANNTCDRLKSEAGVPLPVSAEFPEHPDPANNALFVGALDLSGWDGVAIWIRRGPDGQPTLRVGITEKHSAEDLNTTYNVAEVPQTQVEGRYCQRFRLCGCAPGTPCTNGYCRFPEDPVPGTTLGPNGVAIFPNGCGETFCNAPNTSFTGKDPLFGDRSCSPALTSDGKTYDFCYNPGEDPNPPAKREACGNPFSRPITVSLDWQLIRVPFSELRQADEAAVAEAFDLKSVKQLVFTHTTGNIDFYVGNIGFYRSLP